MKKFCLSNLQYLLLAILVMAMTGCGASSLSNLTGGNGSGSVAAKLVWGTSKTTAKKALASVPAGVTTVQVTVTGSDNNGNAIPVVRGTADALTGQGLGGIYPGTVSLVIKAMTGNTVSYEGFVTGVVVNSGVVTSIADPIIMSPPMEKAQDVPCIQCHETTLDTTGQNIVAEFKQSGHYTNLSWNSFLAYTSTSKFGALRVTGTGCAACHGPSHNDANPSASGRCYVCHYTFVPSHQGNNALILTNNCITCHNAHNPLGPFVWGRCTSCHSVGQNAPGGYVSDNTGVRAITGVNGEFEASTRTNTSGYRSHHIYNGTGIDPQDAQCIACHLEGTSGPGGMVILDNNYHMIDSMVHLRSGKHSITPDVAWDPANPVHSDMDNFCMSCHNAAGAVDAYANISSALKAMTPIPNALPVSAKNPFGDQLKNAYDGLTRPQVVAVYEQFDTGNVSHHAVRGKKYTARTRAASAYAANFTQYSGATQGNIHISANGTPQVEEYFGSYSTSGPAAGYASTKSSGSRKTLYEANLFTATYTTLNGTTLGDDSTLHCGDCHSVGQWAPGTANAVAADGVTIVQTSVAIGAHGSRNEYMLRTSNGTDALHAQGSSTNGTVAYATNGTYVCYLCHKQQAYADNNYFKTDAGVGVTAYRNHGGLHNSGACESSAWNSAGKVGYTTRVGVVGSGVLSSVFGYTCANCHSSGNQIFGGIHGNAAADGSQKNIKFLSYSTDGTDITGATLPGGYTTRSYATEHDTLNAVARLPYRFMGGTSLRYNGGGSASKWEAKTLNGKHREGCYNLTATTDTTKLWNTTAPQQSLAGGPGGNAILNNGGNDSAIGASDYSARTAQNSGTAGWGACNHHQGSTTGSSTAPTRSVQRPLVY